MKNEVLLVETKRAVGLMVVAKMYNGTAYPKTYSSLTQAYKAVAKLVPPEGKHYGVTASWPFLVGLYPGDGAETARMLAEAAALKALCGANDDAMEA